MFSVEVADRMAVDFSFGEVADYQIKTIEVVAFQCLLTFTRHDDLVTELSQNLFKQIPQLIAVIDDENSALFHPTPIQLNCFEERFSRTRETRPTALYEILSRRARNISEMALRVSNLRTPVAAVEWLSLLHYATCSN